MYQKGFESFGFAVPGYGVMYAAVGAVGLVLCLPFMLLLCSFFKKMGHSRTASLPASPEPQEVYGGFYSNPAFHNMTLNGSYADITEKGQKSNRNSSQQQTDFPDLATLSDLPPYPSMGISSASSGDSEPHASPMDVVMSVGAVPYQEEPQQSVHENNMVQNENLTKGGHEYLTGNGMMGDGDAPGSRPNSFYIGHGPQLSENTVYANEGINTDKNVASPGRNKESADAGAKGGSVERETSLKRMRDSYGGTLSEENNHYNSFAPYSSKFNTLPSENTINQSSSKHSRESFLSSRKIHDTQPTKKMRFTPPERSESRTASKRNSFKKKLYYKRKRSSSSASVDFAKGYQFSGKIGKTDGQVGDVLQNPFAV